MEEIRDFPRSAFPRPLAALDPDREKAVLALCAHFSRSRKGTGPALHSLIRRFLSEERAGEAGLLASMQDCFGRSFTQRHLDFCLRRADEWRGRGIRVAEVVSPHTGGEACRPSVLFFKGDLRLDIPWLCVFNSRKPRIVSPRAEWLEALRHFLNSARAGNFLLAASEGTLTYDMTAAHALRAGIALVLVLPYPISGKNPGATVPADGPHRAVLSCLPAANACSKPQRLVCRDRLLARLSSIHLVLELRSRGNLQSVLAESGSEPVLRFVFDPREKKPSNAGNRRLLDIPSGHTRKFSLPARIMTRVPDAAPSRTRSRATAPVPIRWRDYLFHYTRACPGHWPGQRYAEYLLDLLDDLPLCGHSAADTLARILSEKIVRAGSGLVRGREGVVSFSAHPPPDFRSLRQWNRSLGRWTVEPYGVAISKKRLRALGAKPAVYGPDETYGRLPGDEKYRFQLVSGAGPSWKHEREWRLRGDLDLGLIGAENGFAFVPGERDREEILRVCGGGFPVVVFEEMPRPDE